VLGGKSSSNTSDEDRINLAKTELRTHIGIGEPPSDSETPVPFFIERTPYSTRGGAAYQHVTCNEIIEKCSYRVAVYLGMNNVYKSPGRTDRWVGHFLHRELTAFLDFYYMRCFEDLVDFSQAAYFYRVQTVTKSTANMRELKTTSIMDGHYFLDGGVKDSLRSGKCQV
jgi:hypothetical protein